MLASGQAGASEHRRYNVGTGSSAAEQAARNAADAVHWEFDWGGSKKTLTVTLPDSAVDGLRNRPGTRYVEVRSKQNGTDIVVTATDTDGASGSASRSI